VRTAAAFRRPTPARSTTPPTTTAIVTHGEKTRTSRATIPDRRRPPLRPPSCRGRRAAVRAGGRVSFFEPRERTSCSRTPAPAARPATRAGPVPGRCGTTTGTRVSSGVNATDAGRRLWPRRAPPIGPPATVHTRAVDGRGAGFVLRALSRDRAPETRADAAAERVRRLAPPIGLPATVRSRAADDGGVGFVPKIRAPACWGTGLAPPARSRSA